MLTGNLQFYPEKVNYQIDKCHRIGPINTKDGTQSTIFQFKTHSFREALYLKRKKCHKKQKNKLSLIKGRRKTVAYVYNNADKLPEIDIFYADTVILNFVLKMLSIKNLSTPSEMSWFLNLFEKLGWDLENFDVDLEIGLTGGNKQQD